MPRGKRKKRWYYYETDEFISGYADGFSSYDPPRQAVADLLAAYGGGLRLVYYHSDRGNRIVAYRRSDPPVENTYRKALQESAGQRRAQVVAMHKSGMSFTEIGKIFGFSRQRAFAIWTKALQVVNDA